ncbi:hypothetical protein BH09ACT6_BH09ACT6_14910 [soil metagenome]
MPVLRTEAQNETQTAVAPSRLYLALRRVFKGTPVWAFRFGMFLVQNSEEKRMNVDPIAGIAETKDIDYAGGGHSAQRLDVLVPETRADDDALPVYVYFHGGGWTSGDKKTVTKYCAHQAATGMVVVNVNYRHAGRFQMNHMIEDAESAVEWVHTNIGRFGGDPERVVLGGDSAGGHIAALFTSASGNAELREHFGMPAQPVSPSVQGLVLHCSAVDMSMVFHKAPLLGKGFVKLLHPRRGPAAGDDTSRTGSTGSTSTVGTALSLRSAAKYLSPIEWVQPDHPAVFVTTSERDYFYETNLRFIDRLRTSLVPVETMIFGRESRNTKHTWQQNYRYPESQTVYERLTEFINRVTAPVLLATKPGALAQA